MMRTAIIPLLFAACLGAAEEPGFVSLFDGRTLQGWTLVRGQGPGYVAQNGVLVCPADGGGNLMSNREYANFVLRLEFRMDRDGNNGIGIRAPLEGHVATLGLEIQIIDNDGPLYKGKLRPEQLHGAIYDVIPARQGFLKPLGEWNAYEIAANGRRVTVRLNGVTVLDTNLDIVREPEILAKHVGLARPSGRIGFLGHKSHVEFRHIRIRELP
jgi:hypothetical protein